MALPPPPAGGWTTARESSSSRRAADGARPSPDSGHGVMGRIPSQNCVLDALQVRPHPFHPELRIAPLQRLEDGQMTLVIALTRAENVQDQPLLVSEQLSEDVEQLDQDGVAGGLSDLPVERHVDGVQD